MDLSVEGSQCQAKVPGARFSNSRKYFGHEKHLCQEYCRTMFLENLEELLKLPFKSPDFPLELTFIYRTCKSPLNAIKGQIATTSRPPLHSLQRLFRRANQIPNDPQHRYGKHTTDFCSFRSTFCLAQATSQQVVIVHLTGGCQQTAQLKSAWKATQKANGIALLRSASEIVFTL